MPEKAFFDDSATLFVQSGPDKSQLFGMNFLRRVQHPFIMRLTGGCGKLEPHHYLGLQYLVDALSGRSDDGLLLPHFSGFCLFGGTRMVRKDDPTQVIPGITEVAPQVTKYRPDCISLGITVKTGHMRYNTPYGIVISQEPGLPWCTIAHPHQTSCTILQPGSDTNAMWADEWKECIRICDAVKSIPGEWQNLLVVYNGGENTRNEVLSCAKLSQFDPFWRILLINGSGRVADELAGNREFLAEYPAVHVCDNNVDSMRAKFLELGALVAS